MKPEILRQFFDAQIKTRKDIREGDPRIANDSEFDSRPGDMRLFYYVRSQAQLQVMSVWLTHLDEFAARVKHAGAPETGTIPTLTL